jgi:hypothetical protein
MAAAGPVIARVSAPAAKIAATACRTGWRRGRPIWASLKPCCRMICVGLAELWSKASRRATIEPDQSRARFVVDPDRMSLGGSAIAVKAIRGRLEGSCSRGNTNGLSATTFDSIRSLSAIKTRWARIAGNRRGLAMGGETRRDHKATVRLRRG